MYDVNDKAELSDNQLIKWMQLARCDGIGDITFHSLLQIYKTPEKALEQIPVLEGRTGKKIAIPQESAIMKEIEDADKLGAQIITSAENATYGPSLCAIKDAPPVITVLGNKELLKKQSIAIVGARSATINSCTFAREVAIDLARLGFNIISGLALGVDTAAHSVVDFSLDTTAVIATGIDVIYPRENAHLHKKIAQNGLIVTEVPFGQSAKPHHFTRRNRIISGLSECIVLIEAGQKSGALITARYGVTQGKKVFAVPGSPMDKRFAGCNSALKKGAKLLESADDVVEVLKEKIKDLNFCKPPEKDKILHKIEDMQDTQYENSQVQEIKNEILSKIDYCPVDIEFLMQNLQTSNNLILIGIIELEIEKKVVRCDGNKISMLYE